MTTKKAKSGTSRERMVTTMLELAARGPREAALMVRVANAGEITEVITQIKKVRVMLKKFAGVATPGTKAAATRAAALVPGCLLYTSPSPRD